MTSDLPVEPLGQVAEIEMGQSPPGDTYNEDGVGLPLVNGPAQFGRTTPVAEKWTTAPTKVSKAGDVVFCVRGSTTGRMVRADGEYVMGRGVAAIRGKHPGDTSYIHFALQNGLPALLQNATGSTFPNLSSRSLSRFQIAWPDAPSRRAIAEVLASLDDRLEWAMRSEALVQGVIRTLAEALEVAAVVPLAELAEIRREMISAEALDGGSWSHYSIPAFDDGQEPTIERGEEIRSGKYRVPMACVLLSKLNPNWHRVWLPEPSEAHPGICSTEFMPIVPRDQELLAPLWAALLSTNLNRQMRERVTGSTGSHQRVRPEDLMACQVADVRTFDEHHRQLLDSLAERLLLLRSERRRLTWMRDALLPKLMSGELRIEDPSRLVGAVA